MRGSLFGLSLKAIAAIAITLGLGVGAILAAAGVAGSLTAVSRPPFGMLAGEATVITTCQRDLGRSPDGIETLGLDKRKARPVSGGQED